MRIIEEFPPNYDLIDKSFNLKDKKPIFTYGDTIYNPHKIFISKDLIEHETIHSIRQINPSAWWTHYLQYPDFRFIEESIAYKHQYNYWCKEHKDRNDRAKFLHYLAAALSSSMYGYCCTYNQAKKEFL